MKVPNLTLPYVSNKGTRTPGGNAIMGVKTWHKFARLGSTYSESQEVQSKQIRIYRNERSVITIHSGSKCAIEQN
jgi:hypothetical protein